MWWGYCNIVICLTLMFRLANGSFPNSDNDCPLCLGQHRTWKQKRGWEQPDGLYAPSSQVIKHILERVLEIFLSFRYLNELFGVNIARMKLSQIMGALVELRELCERSKEEKLQSQLWYNIPARRIKRSLISCVEEVSL